MGVLDLFKPGREAVAETRSALDAAAGPGHDDSAVTRMVQRLLETGLDGLGPLSSAQEVAAKARRDTTSTDAAIAKVMRQHVGGGTAGGFVTGFGGFVTMPIALPVNVVEFYVQATRMVGAIATLRGYDVSEPQVRSAILLTLVGSQADDVLAKAGLTTGSSRVTSLALRKLPPAALLMVNKAIGFRLLRGIGEKGLSRLGRGVPFVGGVLGAGIDGYLMKKIADHAREEFPQVDHAS